MHPVAVARLIDWAEQQLAADRHPQEVLEEVLDRLAAGNNSSADSHGRSVTQNIGVVEAGSMIVGMVIR